MDTELSSTKKIPAIMWIILAVALVAVSMLGIWAFRHRGEILPSRFGGMSGTSEDAAAPLTEKEIKDRYVASLTELATEVQTMNVANQTELVETVEEKLMEVRVPGERREVFIQTFLAIGKLRETGENSEALKTKILQLINSLRASA
ncbi:MAG TPA: hypothetical protein PK295_01710 [Candidatus Magasanikbacteria bacterium]|nr:hypothetical protein [Candidatus Magasanikbacteria bacterium]